MAWRRSPGGGVAAALDLLARALRRQPLVLVFDNFKDNLTLGGSGWSDEATEAVLQRLVDACQVGKLLITCRYPLPGLMRALHQVPVGPLSPSETRWLYLRLDGLARLGGEDVALVGALIGGHRRVLELLDALLRRGQGVGRVRGKLHALAEAEGIDLSEDRDTDATVSQAVRLGARDIVLDELLAVLGEDELQVLLQVAVSSLPVTTEDLTGALAETGISAEAVARG